MIFIDPKGIRNLGNFNDEKIKFCISYIKEIERKIQKDLENKKEEVILYLDAFIISTSEYDKIKEIFGDGNHEKIDFEKHNISFQEDKNYLEKIFNKIGINL